MKSFISGAEVRELFGLLPFELAKCVRDDELLAPIDPKSGKTISDLATADIDQALFYRGLVLAYAQKLGVSIPDSDREAADAEKWAMKYANKVLASVPTEKERHKDILDSSDEYFASVDRWVERAERAGWVEESETGDHLATEDTAAQQNFTTPEEVVAYCRGKNMRELYQIARVVDQEFTGNARLSDSALGRLLPAKGAEAPSLEGCRSQGKRLRREYETRQ